MRDGNPLRARAEAHIAAMSRRTPADHDRLANFLTARCWPDGVADRTDPAATGWVRRWGLASRHAVTLRCTCPRGRCPVCN
jgi:hypothetical protein